MPIPLLAALPALIALCFFGVLVTPDTGGYVAYAHEILSGAVPWGAALLHQAPAPVSLFRAPGYPAVLAAAMAVGSGSWRVVAVLLQVAVTAGVAWLAAMTAGRLGASRRGGWLVALLPAIGFSVVVQIAVLTDALAAACLTAAALLLAGWRAALAAGALLAVATLFREATPFIALFFLPLAWAGGTGRVRRVALTIAPPILAAALLAGWNLARIGQPVLTTSRQTVMVQALLPLAKRGLPVFAGDDAFDGAAQATVGGGEYAGIDALHIRLFEQGWTAPAMASAASVDYWRAWRRFPLAMLRASLDNIRLQFLWLPFQPIDTVNDLLVYANAPRPDFSRLNILWSRLRRGDAGAGLWIVADVATRLIGVAISLAALILPWRRRDPCLIGLWFVVVGLAAVYLPVHIETRYLVPAVPLVCLLAVSPGASSRNAARRADPSASPRTRAAISAAPAAPG